jgi:hypothetical protein
VSDVMRVTVAQRFYYLHENLPGIILREISIWIKSVKKLSPFAKTM